MNISEGRKSKELMKQKQKIKKIYSGFVFKVLSFFRSPFTVHRSRIFRFFSTLYALRSTLTFPQALRSLFFVLLSAVLLILAHPPYNLWFLAWIALVPFFFAIEGKHFWQSFRLGYLAGIFYFFGMFWWFIYVTLPGMILLNMFLALYFALFAAIYAVIPKKSLWLKVFLTCCAWTAWEFVRSTFLSGFGWAALGHTQYQQIWLIQLAAITGVFGVSFFLVFINQFFYFTVKYLRNQKMHDKTFKRFAVVAVFVLLCLFLNGFLGMFVFAPPSRELMRVAVVQPNIAQQDKWDPLKRSEIMRQLWILSERAAAYKPDMIVWPESSLPADPHILPEYLARVHILARETGTPILLGYVRKRDGKYFNTAGLINRQGRMLQQYDKLHLVPFGEFIPLRRLFPFLSTVVPIEDISPGTVPTLFQLKGKQFNQKFSVLICFEDTISHVARKLVRSGAEILVNITNDAWFHDTKAPWLHLQAAVFQAAAYRRPLVRSANTGVSGNVSRFGRIEEVLIGESGRAVFCSGIKIFEVHPHSEKTFYLVFGDIFAYLCIACLILGVIIKNINIKGKERL